MSQRTDFAEKYESCKHIQRGKPLDYVDEATLENFAKETDLLPLFEMKIYLQTRKTHYSMKTNKLLQCCWQEFLNTLGGRQRAPVQFPKNSDDHFYKYHTRFEPSQSISSRQNFYRSLRPGPGVDVYGHIPIPNEMFVRRK